ncbi:MAG: HepT-like ribonuclease domain-containing protein [bacterium]
MSKRGDKELKKQYKNVEWIEIAGMRDKIIHFYFGVKWSIVWSAIKDKLPGLKANVDTILKEIE